MLRASQNPAVDLAASLAHVRARIDAAQRAAGRSEHCVTLLAISKGHPAEAIAALAEHGVADFGENYLQEALPKIDSLRTRMLSWHYTGALQANKTRAIAERFAWVHTVDRMRVAERLDAQRPPHAARLQVCVQLRDEQDARGGGCDAASLPELCAAVLSLPRLRLRGLMYLPPGSDDPHSARRRERLRWARERFEALRARFAELDTLSMGMSDDLEAAILEGATIVRVGTALFGMRPDAQRDAQPR